MEQSNKIKISKKEFDDIYEITEITGEDSKDKQDTAKPTQENTTPEFLTEEEQEQDDHFHSDMMEDIEQ